jgi:DNA-binding transcriptional regulator LsrR (DeoR family)
METKQKIKVKTKKTSKDKASAKSKDIKPKKSKAIPNTKKIPKIKIWMMEKNINQKDLAKRTELSSNTINRFVNKGKATKSVIKLISYELGISFEELNDLLNDNETVVK